MLVGVARCTYPLRPQLPDTQLGTDRANRGNAHGRELIGEHPRSLLMQRIFPRDARTVGWDC